MQIPKVVKQLEGNTHNFFSSKGTKERSGNMVDCLESAESVLALLDEPEDELKVVALERLNELVGRQWHEVSERLPAIEALSEDERFPRRALASLVASKVYFHLDRHAEALSYALGAGDLFCVSEPSEFAATLVRQCVDEYVRLRVAGEPGTTAPEGAPQPASPPSAPPPPVDPRLVRIVEGLFEQCYAEGQFKLAAGLAIECRRPDIVETAATRGGAETLAYCRRIALDEPPAVAAARPTATTTPAIALVLQQQVSSSSHVTLPRQFRLDLLRLLERLYRAAPPPTDYPSLVACLTVLNDSAATAAVLTELAQQKQEVQLVAYQLAFDLCSNAPQHFLQGVINALPAAGTAVVGVENLRKILVGDMLIEMYLEFLYRNNHTDMQLLATMKASADARNSITHNATVMANALMHAGTTVDTFLRENLEWLSRATNWAKFSATAGLGVIHSGHHKQALQLLAPYLPPQQPAGGAQQSGSPYSEGGALYALGLIHANHGGSVTDYLVTALHNASSSEIVLHGGCLGLGLAAMATGNDMLFEELKGVLYAAEAGAVAGEAAGLAMGLVLLGTASPRAAEMIAYAHETAHERISRGLVLGIALIMYGRQEEADVMIEQLCLDKDAVLRYGGAYAVGLAYCGTASPRAIRRLLHMAVSDVSDDVRRASLAALGFVLFRQPRQCPHLVSLLTDSFNPHVRYGSTLALGIACAGTALPDAVALLEPMTRDPVDFVRQGAMIALAMVLIQANKAEDPRAEAIAKAREARISDKREDAMSRLGAILATGIANAGGRNVTVSLATASGNASVRAVVGMAVFCQYWYWFPYVHFLSLAFSPTAVIAVDANMKQVPLKFRSNAPPSTFAYPEPVKVAEKATAAKGPSVVLSYGRGKQPEAAKKETATTAAAAADVTMTEAAAKEAEEKKKEEETKKEEPAFQILTAPCRVTMRQRAFLSFDIDERYSPAIPSNTFGIVVVCDKGEPAAAAPAAVPMPVDSDTSKQQSQLQSRPQATRDRAAASADEPEPPAPFELADL